MIVDNHQYNSPLRPNQHRSGLSYYEKILFFLGSLFVVVGILTLLEFKFKIIAQFTSESNEVNENVLAAHDLVPYTQFQSNLRYVLNNSAEVLNGLTISGDIEADGSNLNLGEGEITASNVMYGITAGEGITITGGQNPIISLSVPLEPTTGVSSIEDLSGAIDLEAGGNISISKDGNKLTISGSSVSDTNTTYSAGIGLELNGTTFNVDFNGIGLQDTASSAASGASIIGVYTGGFTNITTITPGASLQTVLETIDSELSIMGGGGITAVGNISSGNAFTSGTPGSNLFIADTGWIGLGSGAGRIVWSDDTTDEISVLGARLGVGLLNPSYELDVAGNIRAGTDIYIGSTALTSTGGAGTLGVDSSSIIYSSASNIQQVLEDLDTAINNFGVGGSGVWLDGGSYAYLNPALTTYLGNNASGGTNKLNSAYFSDNSLLSLGTDNDFRMLFNGTSFILGDTSNTFLSIGDSGTTGNFNFNNGQFYIRGDGNVGIGTTSPNAKVEVNSGSILQTAGQPVLIGSTTLSDTIYDIQIVNKYAYVATGSDGNDFHVVDISDPRAPIEVGALAMNGSIYGLQVMGQYVYAVTLTSNNAFHVIDISDPTNPVEVATLDLIASNANAQAIEVQGKYAYVGTGSQTFFTEEFVIIDISDPINPVEVGSYNLPSTAISDIHVQGKYAYVNSWDALYVFDISDPTNPAITDSVESDTITRNSYVDGKYAYITNNNSEVVIIDITDPYNLSEINTITLPSTTGDVYVAGGYLYVGLLNNGANELYVYDISSISSPQEIASLNLSQGIISMYVQGKYLYAGIAGGPFYVIDITGIEASSANIGTIATNQIDINDSVYVGNQVFIKNGLHVGGGGASIGGNFSIGASYDLSIGNIRLGGTGGAGLIGVNTSGFGVSTAPTVQGQLSALNAAISGLGSGPWTDVGSFLIPASGEYLGNIAVGGTGKLSGAYFADNSLISLGTDNDFRMLFNGTNFILGDTSNTFLSIGDSGATANFAFNVDDFYIRGDGNIGIGTTTPGQMLTIASNISSDTLHSGLFSTGGNLIGQNYGGAYFGRVGITENQWSVSDAGVTWIARGSSKSWLNVAMSSDGKYQTATSGTSLTPDRIYTSADYGVTWTARDSNRSWQGVAMSADGKIQTANAYNGQIYTSTDYGATWTARASTGEWSSVAMSSDGKYQTAGQANGRIYRSSDYGATWTITAPFGSFLSVAMSSDGKIQTAVAYSGQIYTSTDYGATWTARDSSRQWSDIAMTSDGKIQTAVVQDGQIYTSTDYGVTWTARDSNRTWLGVAMSSDGKIQTAVAYSGQIYTSTDYGATWTARDSNRSWAGVAMSSDGKIQTALGSVTNIYTSHATSLLAVGNIGIGVTSQSSKFAIGGLGSNTGTNLVIDSSGNVWRDSSSLRYKDDISALVGPFDKIYELDPVKYRFKGTDSYTIGYVAEDLHALGLTDLVIYDNEGRPDAIKYDRLSLYNLELLKEQKLDIDGISSVLSASETSFNAQDTRILGIQDELTEYKAELDSLQDQIDELFDIVHNSNKVATEEASITKLTDRVSFLEQMLFGTEASDEASLSQFKVNTGEYPDGEVLGIEDGKLTVEDLTVTGKTNLYDLGVIGDMSVGQLVVRGREATINSLALPLQIQSQATAEIQLMAGKVVIDTDGNLTVQEEITAKKYNIDTSNDEESSAGSVVIKKGEVEIEIETTSLTESSLIFTSPKKIAVPVATEVIGKNKFLLKLDKKLTEDLEVSWWIVN